MEIADKQTDQENDAVRLTNGPPRLPTGARGLAKGATKSDTFMKTGERRKKKEKIATDGWEVTNRKTAGKNPAPFGPAFPASALYINAGLLSSWSQRRLQRVIKDGADDNLAAEGPRQVYHPAAATGNGGDGGCVEALTWALLSARRGRRSAPRRDFADKTMHKKGKRQ